MDNPTGYLYHNVREGGYLQLTFDIRIRREPIVLDIPSINKIFQISERQLKIAL